MKIGLLIVDMQEVFLHNQKNELNVAGACEHINHVADLLRSNNHCVIHVQDIEGADDHNPELLPIIPEIEVNETDIRITKEESNAFWNTDLEQILIKQQISLVIVAGFAAEQCVLFTYNGAKERGFKTVLLQNGILSTHGDVIASTYRDRNLVSYPVIEFMVS
ncbi:cysteine hydrolase family protein [Paenibacillus mendelii]|uniref:Cysteine hydrolase family protein n=1 Tax=Paenibacillus mendelii TaxID=206163 RepID=A0ABV6JFZ5_9BACL|nr:isochorismatase family cysteine hydrolase [Paenibacillus mendelii]MCQ6557237.1 cysteine hydrolase [Paenibacillus mendelii]